jgi:hypothetical protein
MTLLLDSSDNGAKLKSDFAEYTTLNRDATVDDDATRSCHYKPVTAIQFCCGS